MKILVTGAAGYIGSILAPMLLKRGHGIIALDNFMYNQSSLLDCCDDKNLTIIRGDARDEDLVSGYLKGVDAIFPLACLTGAPICARDPVGAQSTNLEAIKEIAYQIRLRNLGGIIIIDFIDMERNSDRETVMHTLEEALKKDRAKTNVITMSDLFKFERVGYENGRVIGMMRPTGLRPKFMEKIEAAGIHLPPGIFGLGQRTRY